MPSTFFGLNIAYTGLLAANANVNTTGNNIANVETEGYTRQKANQTAADALRISTTYGMAGSGVTTVSIDQIRNKYYDYKYWNSQSDLGKYEERQHYMYQIEDYFTETDTCEGFATIYTDAFNALEEVYKSNGDATTKSTFLSQAGNLCEYFGAMSTNLTKLQLDANEEIKTKVARINSIAEQIATLNKQINTIEINGPRANDLRDKRNVLVDELSKIVNVQVVENPIYTGPGSKVESGIYKYEVMIAGGQQLVNGYEYETLECVARNYQVNQSDADGLYDIRWSNGLDFNIYGNNLEGELKGLIEVRDGNNEEFFHGKLTASTPNGKGTDREGKEVDLYEITIDAGNIEYLNDEYKCKLADRGRIVLGSTEYEYTNFECKVDEVGNATYTFNIYNSSAGDPSKLIGKECAIGTSVNYQGIPYYMEQMNEWVREFAFAMNKIETGAQDVYGNQAEVMFTAKDIIDNDHQYKFGDYDKAEDSKKASFTSREYVDADGKIKAVDSYYRLTASNFQVNTSMTRDVGKFGTTADISQGRDAQDITEKLMTVQNDKNQVNFRGCSAGEFLQCILGDIALNTSSAVTFTKNFENIVKSINTQRISVSGVDNDEEALNLVKFQDAYNLAAKMMQVMTEIYDRLIKETGV